MMVPVGRLTIVRTFSKSDLVRAMSFVSIPALIGPMLGTNRRRADRGYLHWRVIFFVNIRLGFGWSWSTCIFRTTTKSIGTLWMWVV